MGLLDSLVGAALGGGQGGQAQTGTGGLDPQVLMGIVTALMNNGGGLSGILAKLQQGGLGDAAQSWVGTGVNQPVSPDALGGALGPDLMGMIARQLGGNQQQAAGTLADLLPGLIDQLTPQGRLPTDIRVSFTWRRSTTPTHETAPPRGTARLALPDGQCRPP